MELTQILSHIKALKQPVFQTRDIVALLNQSTTTVSKALARLAAHNHLIRLNKGLWAMPEKIEPFMLPEYLTAPYPSYISLQTALHYHGIIEQIPENIYAVSIGRTNFFQTPIANISVHHLPPALYFGYETVGKNNIKMATSEKALFDFLYLQPAKHHLFSALPEIEIPKHFNRYLFKQWIAKIPALYRRTMMRKVL